MRHKKVEKITSNKKNEFCIMTLHEQKLEMFKNRDILMKEKNSKLKELKQKETIIETNSKEYTYKYKKSIKESIKNLEKDLIELSLEYEMNYLLESSPILMEFYSIEKVQESDKDFVKKNNLIYTYLKLINHPNIMNFNISTELIYQCKYCNTKMQEVENEDEYECKKCNYYLQLPKIDKTPSFDDLSRCGFLNQNSYNYEKEDYLGEYLKKFENSSNKTVPINIIHKVIVQFNKEGIKNFSKLNESDIKKCLKKINHQEYYDSVINILNRINGRENFVLPDDIKQKLKLMFRKINDPYQKHKPKSRKSFFSYPYILHQFFKILDFPELSKFFPLLKSDDKLRIQDEIFKKVVDELKITDKETEVNWVFYPTI